MNAPIKIMVVEDESIVAFNLQQRLSRLGYDVPAVAASGEEALRLVDQLDPDLVLMDIHIQGEMDGIEVASRLNASHPLSVIFLTAYSEDATIERARATRPYGYLLKPFSEREMHATITMALERHKVELELGASEERLRLALEVADMGVWDMDGESRNVLLSERSSDILGLGQGVPVTFGTLLECVDGADRERVCAEFERCLVQLIPYHVEFRSATERDSEHWIRLEARSLPDRRVIGVMQDISARKAVEEKLRQLNDNLELLVLEKTSELRRSLSELDTFSYSVAHDLRAPLRGIVGFSQILLQECGAQLDASARRYLDKICNAGNRMAQLIDGLLNLSRLSRGQLQLCEINLSSVVGEIAQQLRETEPARVVIFDIAPDLVAQADAVLVSNLLEILIRNAWKFTSKHASARIEFGVEQTAGEAVYFVRDDGAGFDAQYASHLFRPFQRLHHSNEFEGNGIGLATAQRIVERHGGRIRAQGVVEQGATIYFTLAPRLS